MEKFEEDLENLKNKINSMTLSDEFKENLSKKLEMEYNKTSTRTWFAIPRQIVAACACCILLTGCVFAGSFGNVITNFFANTSKEMEQAIESGEVQYINMDYVERDGVSIKVDYAMAKNNSLYLVFNVLSDEEISRVSLEEYEIKNNNQEVLYDSTDIEFNSIEKKYTSKRVDNKNVIIFAELKNDEILEKYKNLNIHLKTILLEDISKREEVTNEWILNFAINN